MTCCEADAVIKVRLATKHRLNFNGLEHRHSFDYLEFSRSFKVKYEDEFVLAGFRFI